MNDALTPERAALFEEAANPKTPPTRLRELYNRSGLPRPLRLRLRAIIASNPSTPGELVALAADEYPRALLENPAVPLLFLEDPAFGQRISVRAMAWLLSQETIPGQLLAVARNHSPRITREIAYHIQVSGEVGEDWPDELRRWLQTLWAIDPNIGKKHAAWEMIELGLLPAAFVEPLVMQYVPEDERNAVLRRGTRYNPEYLPILELLQCEKAGLQSGRSNERPPASNSAGKPGTPRPIPGGVAAAGPYDGETWPVRPEGVPAHEWFAGLSYEETQRLVLDPAQSPEVLLLVARKGPVFWSSEIGGLPHYSPARDSDGRQAMPTIGELLAQHPRSSTKVLREIMHGASHEATLQALLDHPRRPPEALTFLATSRRCWNRRVAASRPLPFPLQMRLAADNDCEVRRRLQQQVPLPAEVLQCLRRSVLTTWTSDLSPLLVFAVYSHPEIPEDRMRFAGASHRWAERLAVAVNPAAPSDLLETLARDGHRYVRAAARSRLDGKPLPDLWVSNDVGPAGEHPIAGRRLEDQS